MIEYCTVSDLRRGDIPLPKHMGDGQQYVDRAAEEIDAALGHIYLTPIVIDTTGHPERRPSLLILKKIAWLLASGRLVLDLAAAGEDSDLHAYGRQMLTEGLDLLQQAAAREFILLGAREVPVPDGEEQPFSGPFIINEDQESLVKMFYDRLNPSYSGPNTGPATWYGGGMLP